MNWALRAALLLLLFLLQGADAGDEVRLDFSAKEDLGSGLLGPQKEIELCHSPEGRTGPGSLRVVNKDHTVHYLSLPCRDACREGEGLLLSLWVKLDGPAEKDSRCGLTMKCSGAKETDRYITLADIPLTEQRWTLLSGWYYRAPGTGQPLAFMVRVEPGVQLLVDDVVLLDSAIEQPVDHRMPLLVNGAAVMQGSTEFVLRGINFYASSDDEGGDTRHETSAVTEEDYRDIARLGFNCVRLCLWYKVFRDDGGWAWVKLHRLWAQRHGLRLILDMHAPPGGYQSNGYRGRFWKSPELQKELVDFWVRAAEVFKNDPVIAAFDLMNEPLPPRDEDWLAFAGAALKAIRAAGWHRPVLVESSLRVEGWAESAHVFEDAAVIYDTHFYTPWSFTSSGRSPYGQSCVDYGQEVLDASFIAEYLERDLLVFGVRNRVPVNIGEFGVSEKALDVGGAGWLADLLDLMKRRGVGGQYFCWCVYGDFALEPGWFRQSPARLRTELLKPLSLWTDSRGTDGPAKPLYSP